MPEQQQPDNGELAAMAIAVTPQGDVDLAFSFRGVKQFTVRLNPESTEGMAADLLVAARVARGMKEEPVVCRRLQ